MSDSNLLSGKLFGARGGRRISCLGWVGFVMLCWVRLGLVGFAGQNFQRSLKTKSSKTEGNFLDKISPYFQS